MGWLVASSEIRQGSERHSVDEPISYSGVSYSCGYSVAIFLLKDDAKCWRVAANPRSLRTHEVRTDSRWEEGPATYPSMSKGRSGQEPSDLAIHSILIVHGETSIPPARGWHKAPESITK